MPGVNGTSFKLGSGTGMGPTITELRWGMNEPGSLGGGRRIPPGAGSIKGLETLFDTSVLRDRKLQEIKPHLCAVERPLVRTLTAPCGLISGTLSFHSRHLFFGS